jgi:hypothetical protein
MVLIPRNVRHHGATGKTLQPTLPVGTKVSLGKRTDLEIAQVRTKRKYARRYAICIGHPTNCAWFRRDELTLAGGAP